MLVTLRGSHPTPTERVRAHRKARSGAWERVHRGIYREGAQADDAPDLELLSILAPGAAWSHGTACALHGLVQGGSLTASREGPRRIYRSVRAPITVLSVPASRLGSVRTMPWREAEIRVVGLERAVLDAVDAPRYVGGDDAVAAILTRAAPRLRWSALLAELDAQAESALVQRLGHLMERLGLLPGRRLADLAERVRPGIRVHLGPRLRGGRLDRRWSVVVHLPPGSGGSPRGGPGEPGQATAMDRDEGPGAPEMDVVLL